MNNNNNFRIFFKNKKPPERRSGGVWCEEWAETDVSATPIVSKLFRFATWISQRSLALDVKINEAIWKNLALISSILEENSRFLQNSPKYSIL